MKNQFLVSFALLSLACPLSGHAELLVYEPFDYDTGDLAGRGGGVGMTGAWADGPDLNGTSFVFDERGNQSGLYPVSPYAPNPTWDGVVDNLPTRPETGSRYLSHSPVLEDKFEAYRPLAQDAGALAANDGDNILWASAVWHFAGQSFGAHAGFALTTDSFVDRGRDLDTSGRHGSGAGDGIGVAGATGSSTSWNSSINAAIFDAGSIVQANSGARFSSTKDNIIVLKFEFGATDTVSAFFFTEDQVMTEAAFNAGAVSASAAIDESTLNLIAFSQNRKENAIDELRIGDTFDDVTTGTAGDPRQPLEVTDVAYHEDSDEITLTWKSNPDEAYGLYWSEDLVNFVPGIDPAVPAHPSGTRTTFGPFANPSPGAARLFLQVGPPDLEDPTLERAWGNGTTISLDFSEAMDANLGIDPANFSVMKAGGVGVAVASAAFHPGPDTIVLTTAAPLELDADYSVTMSGLADLAGRPLSGPAVARFRTWDDNPTGVKVFIMAGQSNMQGHGRSEIGFGGVAAARGSLRFQVGDDPDKYGHLVDAGGTWISRSDVKVWWRDSELGAPRSVKKGDLHPSFGVDSSRFGPEYGFGWQVGDHYEEPVLLVKAAWGGKNLFVDFRPPSAAARGGEVGAYYTGMFDDIHEVLDQLGTEFPEWSDKGYQIVGFGWHQGWNDRGTPFFADHYEENLVDLINDLRAEFGKPELPVAIATTGMDPQATLTTVELAQLAVADPGQHPEFTGTVDTADTRPFWRDKSVSPADQGFHWNQNGESYYLIGEAMGLGMLGLLAP